MIEGYLGATFAVLQAALNNYARVFAFRVDLRFPAWMDASNDEIANAVMTRCIESFKAKIRHNRERAKQKDPNAPDTVVRYVWAREFSQDGRVHYHVAFLLNGDAFFTLGEFELGRANMYCRLVEAWASALGIPVEMTEGLVQVPQNPVYNFRRDDSQAIAAFFYRLSYLCKEKSKHFGNGQHGYGTSRY